MLRFFLILIAAALAHTGCSSWVEGPGKLKSKEQPSARFVDEKSCIACHDGQHREWTGSHHALAMQEATPGSVLGDFDDSTFTAFGLTTKFFRRGGNFIVRTDGPEGRPEDYEVSYVFGIDPLQQYLIAFPDGRYQALDIAWDTRPEEHGGQRWFHLHPDESITSKSPLHWTGLNLNWNYMCAECHSTDLKKNYDPATDTYKTAWSEINVGCQGCHGPASNHVAWAETAETGRRRLDKDASMGLEVDLGGGLQVEACARCHGRRSLVKGDYRYGADFMDHYVPQLLIEPYYYPDGQIKDEVYVYGSFIQSKKFSRGVRCTNCHNPHRGDTRWLL